MIINPRPKEKEFFNKIHHSPHDILARPIGDLKDAGIEAGILEKVKVFDIVPPTNEVLGLSFPQSKSDN